MATDCAFAGGGSLLYLAYLSDKTENPILVKMKATLTATVPCFENWGHSMLNFSLESITLRVLQEGADSFSCCVVRSVFLLCMFL